MKKVILITAILYSVNAYSQTPAPTVKSPVITQRATQDTTIIKDENDKNREFEIIKNSNGIILSQGSKLNGKKDGVWRIYNIKGNLTNIEEYRNGMKNGASISFASNSQVQQDATYKNDSLDGQKTIFQNSRIKSVEMFSNGILDGPRKSYYDDGKIQEEGVYKNGKREGLSRWYLQSGKPSVEYNYTNGILEGKGVEYNEKGFIKREGLYKNNSEEGEWKEYTDSILSKKIIYKGGEIVKEVKIVK